MYGGLCTDVYEALRGDGDSPETAWVDFGNRLQDALDKWLRAGRPDVIETLVEDVRVGMVRQWNEGTSTVIGIEPEGPRWLRIHNRRSEEHTSELQSLMRSSYAVFCSKKKMINNNYKQKAHNTS